VRAPRSGQRSTPCAVAGTPRHGMITSIETQ
jgi:hypothetical protein